MPRNSTTVDWGGALPRIRACARYVAARAVCAQVFRFTVLPRSWSPAFCLRRDRLHMSAILERG